jgi:hypothetical protein
MSSDSPGVDYADKTVSLSKRQSQVLTKTLIEDQMKAYDDLMFQYPFVPRAS